MGGGQFRKLNRSFEFKSLKNKKKFILFSILTLLLLVGIFSVTYAYLNARVTLEKTNIVTSGILKVDLKEDTPITVSKAYPITEEAGLGSKAFTFQLKNTGNLNTSYTIYLDDVESNNSVSSQYLRYSLLKDGKYATNGTSALFSSLSASPNRILDVGSIFAGVTYRYELRIWIDLDAPNSVQGKSWQGRLRVEQEASEETCFTVVGNAITGYSNSCPRDVVIPSYINGKKITTIQQQAFYNKNLTSIVIEEGITSIGQSAFSNNPITHLSLPKSVNLIDVMAFNNNLLPDDEAFIYARNSDGSEDKTTIIGYGGANKDVVIPSGVTRIGEYAFHSTSLNSVIIPEGVTQIEYDAFRNNQLTELHLPSTLSFLSGSAFNGNQLKDEYAFIYQRNNDGSEDKTTIIGYGGANKDLVIPEGVVTIGTSAFSSCGIKSVRFPTTLKTIGNIAFRNNSLTDINIPSSVTSIGGGAFNRNQLPEEKAFIYGRNSDGSENKTTLVSYGGNQLHVVVPFGVKVLSTHCFYTCYAMESIELPEGLESIGYWGLTQTGLKEVTIPSTVIRIENSALTKNLTWNTSLTKIINKTGRSFDWGNIINGSSGYQFVSGMVYNNYGNVEVTN